jgi:hypothetical protein
MITVELASPEVADDDFFEYIDWLVDNVDALNWCVHVGKSNENNKIVFDNDEDATMFKLVFKL